ncbi:MAG: DUF99 family protein [Blastocatellia bacterium]|nr:DUF99 family protein [Blastocatellia bacterium]
MQIQKLFSKNPRFQPKLLGIDDAPFPKNHFGAVKVLGTVFRGGDFLEGLISTYIDKDGFNATEKLISMICQSKFYPQLHCILLNGITFGGFNLVDIENLYQETNLPVIAVMRKQPDFLAIEKALTNLENSQQRLKLIEKAGQVHQVGHLFCQFKGLSFEETTIILKLSSTHSHLPEPLRVAHIIGAGFILGQSGNRA